MIRKIVIAGLAAVAVSACAGRDAVPVAQVQSYDTSLSCDQITAEQASISTKVSQLQSEKSSAENTNIAVGVVGGLLFWPALFALDLSDAEQVEMDALRARSQHLTVIAGQRGCFAVQQSVPTAVPAPVPFVPSQTTSTAEVPVTYNTGAASQTPATSRRAGPR